MNLTGSILGYNKKILLFGVILMIVVGISFLAGAKYEKHKLSALGFLVDKNEASVIKGFLSEKKENSLLLKMDDGNLREIAFNATLTFGVDKKGTRDDLLVGQLLVVTGKNNPDGTFVAENIRKSKKSPKIQAPEKPQSETSL